MMKEILTASKLDDEKRLKEILSMTKTRLQDSFPFRRAFGSSTPGNVL